MSNLYADYHYLSFTITIMDWTMPSAEEARNQGGNYDNIPLISEDYIVKIAKVELGHFPQWNQALKRFDDSKTSLEYQLTLLPYKFKAEDGLKDTNWNDVAPLRKWIWRKVNPFAIAQKKDGSPTFLRSVIAYTQDNVTDVNWPLKIPGAVIIDKENQIVTDSAIVEKYKEEFVKVSKGEITHDQFTSKKAGYRHIPDIRSLEGKYISAKVIADDKGRNKITSFSKLPSSFAPDLEVEKEAMSKFAESYEKLRKNRQGEQIATSTVTEETFNDDVVDF